jgi:hypothetical protein
MRKKGNINASKSVAARRMRRKSHLTI